MSADRFNIGKTQISQVPSSLIIETAKVLEFGAQKYSRDNWKKGMSFLSVYDSLQRHLLAWKDGQDLDEESGLPHLAHASCNLAFLIEFSSTRKEFDDRTSAKSEKELKMILQDKLKAMGDPL
jgi:hypothetical protein